MAKEEPAPEGQFEVLLKEVRLLREEVARLGARVNDIRSLVGPFGLTMPDGTVLVQTIFGTKYFIDPSDMIIAPNLIIYRQWEADLSALMVGAVTPDTFFIDVGANFGYFTCLLGSRIGNRGRGQVVAIEPNSKMIELLKRNVSVNWSMAPISVQECAVADRAGTAQFYVPVGRASNASLVLGETRSDTITVKMQTLDSLIPDGRPVDLMKIDVEGHEYSTLRGAERVIAQSTDIRIVMEWSQHQMISAGYSVSVMLDLLDNMRLVPHRIPEDRRMASTDSHPLDRDQMASLTYDNIILKRRERLG